MRSLLMASPDPDQAIHMLVRLQEERPEAFYRLTASVAGLPFLISVFSYSRFLSEAVLRSPEWLEELTRADDMDRVLSQEEYGARLEAQLEKERFLDPAAAGPPSTLSLASFRRRQLLRILLRDVQGYCTLTETTEELSNLADAILEVTCQAVLRELEQRFGPRRACSFAVISLGKLGGRELNYSSDIDLMFVHGGGAAEDAEQAAHHDFFRRLTNRVLDLLSAYSTEGRCYRVDLRLRPDGRQGDVCISLDAARKYYQERARDWELQMLIKARVSAGDRELGRALLESAETRIYSTSLDFSALESMSATRERINERVAARAGRQTGLDIKLARGGIRDIEFLVQCLQRLHGGREPWVRHGGTLLALFRLRDKSLLSDAEYSKLASAYQFLRTLEHRLQFEEDLQVHTLPRELEDLESLALKMPPGVIGGAASAETLLQQLNQHLEEVQELYERVIHAQQPMYYGAAASDIPEAWPDRAAAAVPETPSSNLLRFLDQRAPRLARLIATQGVRRGRKHLEHFLELILPHTQWLERLDGDAELASRALDLFEHSPYFADQMIRSPELLDELGTLGTAAGMAASSADGIDELRRFFQRDMLRIQAESICLRTPIFTTLEQTSELADIALRTAYRLAAAEVAASKPPRSAGYTPGGQLLTIALGRLGMREFDLASDADLVFVLADEDRAEMPFWTRVAERMIDLVTAYTGYGVIFAVDTRLRPNGRAGPLVQTESGYTEYFTKSAEAWEGITYMKSRAVAGDTERATRFLQSLQDVDWRRHGQGGRSRKALVEMRARLEREQGPLNPLKAGRGGYYDIDFALMYLRLRGAGIFYKFLNTPARIDVIEKMGHLEAADAEFLRDAATFYRAVDHGLRVSTGHTEGDLPGSPSQLENLTELIGRWTPDHLRNQPLDVELAQIQARTREYFNRLFTG
ncbi:MAG: glutamine-synthetase adenylyltransferase [Bryobacterales bacterium]|nr:glutamine-synthetase adenylyltransferase [Bryobacterales bacterium]